jgi:hypothetical protein
MMNFMIGELQRLSFDQASSSASPPLKIVLEILRSKGVCAKNKLP